MFHASDVTKGLYITTLSAEKRVRNYSEFTRKRVAKKTGP